MVRAGPAAEEPEAVLVLSTLGAPERRLLRGRRGRRVTAADPEPVPTSRVTVTAATPFGSREQAANWLADLRGDGDARDGEIARALGVVNRALHSYRVAAADPHARDVGADQALVVRVGYGSGDAIVTGRYAEAWELPRPGASAVRRSMEAPEERFAALLGARERVLACEELVLRARADLDGGRQREAALQARIALEALLAELGDVPGGRRGPLEADRAPVGDAANAALDGELSRERTAAIGAALERMESALRARRLSTAT